MNKNKKVFPFVLASVLATTPFFSMTPAHAVTGVKVTAEDTDAGDDSDYTIEFKIEEDLDEGDNVYIEFDEDFEIDKKIDEKDVKINNKEPESVELDDNKIEIEAPKDYKKGTKMTIKLNNVITNPDEKGKYDITVSTDSDDDDDTASITIGKGGSGGGGGGKGDYSVNIGDNTAGKRTSYELTQFDLDSDLEEDEWITVTFPTVDMLPGGIDEDDVTINGKHPYDIKVNGRNVEMKIPDDVDGDDKLKLTFSNDASINNPAAKSNYTLKVEYDKDVYESSSFDIKSGSYDTFAVSPSNSSAGQRASYVFYADFGTKARFKPLRTLTVEFPEREMLPSSISTSDVLINGKKPKKVVVEGKFVSITAPMGFNADNDVIVTFTNNAGINNPRNAGTYQLKASIPDKTLTSKSFTIY